MTIVYYDSRHAIVHIMREYESRKNALKALKERLMKYFDDEKDFDYYVTEIDHEEYYE